MAFKNPIDSVKSITFDIFSTDDNKEVMLSGINGIIYDVILYLYTSYGEKLNNFEFGGNLQRQLFEFDVDVINAITRDFAEDLKKVEDRLVITSAAISQQSEHIYVLNITLLDPNDVGRTILLTIDLNKYFY